MFLIQCVKNYIKISKYNPLIQFFLLLLCYQGSSYIASSEMEKRKQGLLISLLLLFHKDQGLHNSQPSWEPNSSALNQATKEADLDAQISALSFLLRNLSQGSPWRSSGEDSTLSLPTGPGSLPSQNHKLKAEWRSTGGKKKKSQQKLRKEFGITIKF